MNKWLLYLALFFMMIGSVVLIEHLVFLASYQIKSPNIGYSEAYVQHLPRFLGLSHGSDAFIFLAGTAFIFLVLPGILFLYYYSEKRKQLYLTFGLIGGCLGALMIWWNM